MLLVRSALALSFSLALTTAASAVPIDFHLNFAANAPSSGPGSALFGAQFDLKLQWDVEALVPSGDGPGGTPGSWHTDWPSDTTVGLLTISGSASLDGDYTPTPFTPWKLANNVGGSGDSVEIPGVQFDLGSGNGFNIMNAHASFGTDFFANVSGTIYPLPFPSTAITDFDITTNLGEGVARLAAIEAVMSAIIVPEPSSLMLLVVYLLSVAGRRVRG